MSGLLQAFAFSGWAWYVNFLTTPVRTDFFGTHQPKSVSNCCTIDISYDLFDWFLSLWLLYCSYEVFLPYGRSWFIFLTISILDKFKQFCQDSFLTTLARSNVETNISWTCLVSGLLSLEHPSVLLFLLLRHLSCHLTIKVMQAILVFLVHRSLDG